MPNQSWLTLLLQQRAIAVIRAQNMAIGYQMAKAVAAGGMRIIEITWNSDRAADLVGKLRAELPHCTIGIGTLLNLEQLQTAIDIGAQFLFTPHTDAAMIKTAVKSQIPIIPGALSPTEIITAFNYGATCVKVFPISTVGGVNYLRSLKPVLTEIPLIPTGGVNLENAQEFIAAGAIAIGLAGDLFPQNLVTTENWEAIGKLSQKLMENLKPYQKLN